MAVKMRLKRMGKKRNPIYRVVIADARSPRDGRNIDEVGFYDPNQEPAVVKFDEEAAKAWLNKGAQPTDTVARLLKNAGIEK
ncbi:MAG: 30S ribosomal protein S16 [Anaerobutyricum sp.]|nr:30S ribosomal protein S16 [Eubacterium sp.]MCI5944026.1 30S ribosomal protein S16 [Eubacterium sp.]MDY6047217.1 30S ribosomal protein S16 [Anaerobutyricum sp.]